MTKNDLKTIIVAIGTMEDRLHERGAIDDTLQELIDEAKAILSLALGGEIGGPIETTHRYDA